MSKIPRLVSTDSDSNLGWPVLDCSSRHESRLSYLALRPTYAPKKKTSTNQITILHKKKIQNAQTPPFLKKEQPRGEGGKKPLPKGPKTHPRPTTGKKNFTPPPPPPPQVSLC